MAKIRYSKWETEAFEETEQGRKYLEYNKKVGGEPLGLIVPFGYPDGVEKMGGVIAVYEKCMELGITCEEVLDFHVPEDVII